jgi:hypothetical protein
MTNGVAWVDWPANTSAKDRASEDVLSPDIHPLAEIFPPMSDEEIKGLIDDIRTNGLRVGAPGDPEQRFLLISSTHSD